MTHDWYILGTWLDALVYGTCRLQVGSWLMHLFMVQVDYRLSYRLMHGSDLLVQVYSGISHNGSVIVVSSFYFYFRVAGWGKDRWL